MCVGHARCLEHRNQGPLAAARDDRASKNIGEQAGVRASGVGSALTWSTAAQDCLEYAPDFLVILTSEGRANRSDCGPVVPAEHGQEMGCERALIPVVLAKQPCGVRYKDAIGVVERHFHGPRSNTPHSASQRLRESFDDISAGQGAEGFVKELIDPKSVAFSKRVQQEVRRPRITMVFQRSARFVEFPDQVLCRLGVCRHRLVCFQEPDRFFGGHHAPTCGTSGLGAVQPWQRALLPGA
jgi:hypothetical protein